jgi:hypothetical protein
VGSSLAADTAADTAVAEVVQATSFEEVEDLLVQLGNTLDDYIVAGEMAEAVR